jgi:hypothetical protein
MPCLSALRHTRGTVVPGAFGNFRLEEVASRFEIHSSLQVLNITHESFRGVAMKNEDTLRQEVIQRVEGLPQDRLQEVLRFVESVSRPEPSSRSIEDKIAAVVGEEDRDVWEDVPPDGAERHDHYIYGTSGEDK